MRLIIFLFFIILSFGMNAQNSTIYSKAYGNSANSAIIFIHGGPSGNATLFEATTAKDLAEKGFYVIVYDRRGEGRSIDTTATFTYQEAFKDLSNIFEMYKIKKANLIGHSFGGLVATLFTEQNPEKVKSLILAGALFSQQQTYDHILQTTKFNYQKRNNQKMLFKISEIESLDKNSADYRKQCFEIASQNNYFKMPFPTKKANELYKDYEESDFYKNNIRNKQAPLVFYKNESRNNIDTKPILKDLKKQTKIFAIYGKQDQIFSAKQLNDLRKITTKSNFKIIDNCSHYLFVDQHQEFIDSVEKWLKP